MRGIIMACKRMEYQDIRISYGMKKNADLKRGTYEDSILVLACVEKGDNYEYIEKAGEWIVRLNEKDYMKKRVIVLPYAHLSNKLERPARATELLSALAEKLELSGLEVNLATFGTNKNVLIDTTEQTASHSYFSFPRERHD